MNRVAALIARLRRLPVRTRIALVSAALTAVILIFFAAVVGRLVSNDLHGDFENDLRDRAAQLADSVSNQIRRSGQPTGFGSLEPSVDAQIRIAYEDGSIYRFEGGTFSLGPPDQGSIISAGSYEVAAARIPYFVTEIRETAPVAEIRESVPQGPIWAQYARPVAVVNDTISRLWLFLAGGVAIGTLLAGLAGMAIASRAMRPIAVLTATARDIATTRDPSRRVPPPETDDEVAELARTFDQMLRELDAARTETEGTIRRQREFVADASHELRTPLTSILANLELLEESLSSAAGEDERTAVGSALRSSKRMNRLVGDLLLLARADAGRAGTQIPCDLASIAAEALEEVEPVSNEHRLIPLIQGPAPVEGNPDELHRMALNLLENAIRHTPPGTSVRLRVDANDDRARLIVADDGPGLPEGMEEQVFRRFVRGAGPADSLGHNGTGTGLGLSIVRAVALAHHGSVVADRARRGGARFTVSLPLAAGAGTAEV